MDVNGTPSVSRNGTHQALEAALEYRRAGFSVIPIKGDGSKAPTIAWDEFKSRLASEDEIKSWYSRPGVGVAVVGGAVSGYMAIIDVEFPDFLARFVELVNSIDPTIIGNLPRISTPGKNGQPGGHLYFKSASPVKTGKLAKITREEALKRTGDEGKTTAIEVKAEGGYVLAPGCPSCCHESGRLYAHVGGPFIEETPTLTDEQVEVLLSCARALDESPGKKVETFSGGGGKAGSMDRPGDIFNREASWDDVLIPHGWTSRQTRSGVVYWTRPGKKESGISATTGYCSSDRAGDLLCVFSTNADPLTIPDGQDHHCYSKFAALAFLEYGGNFLKAAQALAKKGYGIDLTMSQAEQYARRQAEEIQDVQDAGKWDELLLKVQKRNAEECWGLSQAEILDVIANAKQGRINNDPKLLSEAVELEIASSAAMPPSDDPAGGPPWKLIRIGEDPAIYMLRAPFWSQNPRVVGNGGYIKVTAKQLRLWSGLGEAAIAQADTCPPARIKGWQELCNKLLANVEVRIADPETQKRYNIATFLYEHLAGAREQTEDENGEKRINSGGSPMKMGGKVAVKSAWIIQVAANRSENISRDDLIEVMRFFGMKAEQMGKENKRSRWWTITQELLDQMLKWITSNH